MLCHCAQSQPLSASQVRTDTTNNSDRTVAHATWLPSSSVTTNSDELSSEQFNHDELFRLLSKLLTVYNEIESEKASLSNEQDKAWKRANFWRKRGKIVSTELP
jgi:hypothetical protein